MLATGGSIGVAVVLARLFTTPGTTMQWVAFGLAALMITIFHCILRQGMRQGWAAILGQLMAHQRRSRVFERFANEANASWMGLRDPLDLGEPLKPSREALVPR